MNYRKRKGRAIWIKDERWILNWNLLRRTDDPQPPIQLPREASIYKDKGEQ
jgi:hypothetical protein